MNNKVRALDTRRKVSPALDTPTDLSEEAVRELSAKLNEVLADAFALYLKTKNFHWHVSGPHFRDYHLLLDEQSEQIFATTDDIAERVRKIGGTTLRSIGQISKLQTIKDNDESFVPAHEMLRELMNDNKQVAASMRECHELCDKHDDVATCLLSFINSRSMSWAGTKFSSLSLIVCSLATWPMERSVVPPILRTRSAMSSVVAKICSDCSSSSKW